MRVVMHEPASGRLRAQTVRMRPDDSCVVYTCSRRDPNPSEDRLDVETMHGLTFHGRPSTRRPAITMHVVRRRATKPGGPVIEFTHSRLWAAPQLCPRSADTKLGVGPPLSLARAQIPGKENRTGLLGII